ncbi:MAG: hypothetical protein RIC80_17130 [Cyclobacteriaceae bacterium]
MRIYSLIAVMLLLSTSVAAQRWEVFERTHNDLISVLSTELTQDTLKLISGKSYEINMPDLFDQNTGLVKKKLYFQNLSMADYIDLDIEHEQNIIDLRDTLYTAKVRFRQTNTSTEEPTAYPAKIVVRDQEGTIEKQLTIMPAYPASRR